MEALRSEAKAPRPRPGPRVIPHGLPWHRHWVAWLIYGLIRLLSSTLRFRFRDRTALFDTEPARPVIFCTWHNRLALSLMVYLKHPKKLQPSRRMAAIVSASRDGAVLARVLELFGVEPVRGSTSRRGPQALLELTTWAERGFDLAITPDGPRGPCYRVQEGVIALAGLTGLPIVPVSYHLNWKIRAGSWDRFQIPLPFARVEIDFDAPVYVERDASPAERDQRWHHLEERMHAITRD
jgi:lysophospholipid acyltransferase (LPLAT)-like uncharacterized protein